MKVVAEYSIVPMGVGVSVSEYIAACQKVFDEAGLTIRLHAYGTNIEGEWDAVLGAIRKCHEVVHAMGVHRISAVLKLGTRTDRDQSLDAKVRSVQEKLSHGGGGPRA